MGKAKASKHHASNISSTANPASSSTVTHASQSSILKCSFSPSRFQLHLFASVIQGLDSQHLRVHDTNTGRLRCDHTIEPKAALTCLDWGYYGSDISEKDRSASRKKRKRNDATSGAGFEPHNDKISLAFGANTSEIQFYSVSEAKVVGRLKDGHTYGIRDLKFVQDGLSGEFWSIGGDSKLVQWNLNSNEALRTISVPGGSANALCPFASSVIVASDRAYLLDPTSGSPLAVFDPSSNRVHSIIPRRLPSSKQQMFLTAAENDRHITVFEEHSAVGQLNTLNEAVSIDYHQSLIPNAKSTSSPTLSERLLKPREVLAVVNKDGVLELFVEPFEFETSVTNLDNTKAKLKNRTRRCVAQVKINKPDNESTLFPLIDASFRENSIVLAWVEGATNVVFDVLQWREESSGQLLFKGETMIAKGGVAKAVGATGTNGVKHMELTQPNESHAIVTNGSGPEDVVMTDLQPEVIDISSAEEESEDSEEDVLAGRQQDSSTTTPVDVYENEVEMDRDEVGAKATEGPLQDEEQAAGSEAPSFGELLRAKSQTMVDVRPHSEDPDLQSLVPPTEDKKVQQPPSGLSLGTVLTQSLRTNDRNLLETCFHVKDLSTIRATIQRLDSHFASDLLQRLAERLHSRPGRAGSLMVWVQWTLIAHGGYLASQPEVMRKLSSLHRVVKERAASLQSLLSLKGKLDMLEAQMNLRKMQQSKFHSDENEDEDAVIYVEGEEDSDSTDESASTDAEGGQDAADSLVREKAISRSGSKTIEANLGSDNADSGADMPVTNGHLTGSEQDDGSDEDEEDEDEGTFDEEASSTDQDSGGEEVGDEVDYDDHDTEADSSDGDLSPSPERPAKRLVLDSGQ